MNIQIRTTLLITLEDGIITDLDATAVTLEEFAPIIGLKHLVLELGEVHSRRIGQASLYKRSFQHSLQSERSSDCTKEVNYIQTAKPTGVPDHLQLREAAVFLLLVSEYDIEITRINFI